MGALFDVAFPTYRPSVGVIVAGGFALGYHGPVIDLMGLNTVAMGHSPAPRVGFRDHAAFDPEVFFTLSPDIVLLSLWSPQRPDWFEFPMLSGVFDSLPESTGDYWNRRAASMAQGVPGWSLVTRVSSPFADSLYSADGSGGSATPMGAESVK